MNFDSGKEPPTSESGRFQRGTNGAFAAELMPAVNHDPDPEMSGVESRGLRIALYSHDTMGFGHLRRNLRIANSLSTGVNASSILLITGACESGFFSMPSGVDSLTLPALRKDDTGGYGSRSLGIPLEQLIRLRSSLLTAALESFEPDVLIVDKVPRGALGELDGALKMLRDRGRTRCVLGLREVLDDPATVRREWRRQRSQQTLCDYYDAVWIYGDPCVYDTISEYGLVGEPQLQIRYTGYLDPCSHRSSLADSIEGVLSQLGLPAGRLALCVVGGGQDGGALAAAFCRAKLPPDMNGVVVTGPLMPAEIREQLRRSASGRDRFRVLEFVADPEPLMHLADRVISMGGYNTVCEVLALKKQSLIVPRVEPRREQLIRAERLRDLDLVDVLLPSELSPEALSDWLSRELPSRPVAREQIDFGGLNRLPDLLQELMNPSPVPVAVSTTQEETYRVKL